MSGSFKSKALRSIYINFKANRSQTTFFHFFNPVRGRISISYDTRIPSILLHNVCAKYEVDWTKESRCPIQTVLPLFTPLGVEFRKIPSYRIPTHYKEQALQVSGLYDQRFRLCVDPSVIQDKGFYMYRLNSWYLLNRIAHLNNWKSDLHEMKQIWKQYYLIG